jgi:hypothetical protein
MNSDFACEIIVIASLQRYDVHGKRRAPFNLSMLLPRRLHSPLESLGEETVHQRRGV